MYAKIRNGLGGNCQWLASMFETNVIEASDILCRNFRSALYNEDRIHYALDYLTPSEFVCKLDGGNK